MYQKVTNQNDSLRGLWAAKFNLQGRKAGLATETDVAAYDTKLHALEEELERRKEIGRKFEIVLQKIREMSDAEQHAKADHQVLSRISWSG